LHSGGTARTPAHTTTRKAAAAPAKRPVPVVPAVAPPAPVLPPPIAVPTRSPPEPAPIVIDKDAPGAPIPAKDGLRVTFGVGRADVNAASDAAVQALARHAAAAGGATFSVTAYAGGNADDPSAPRRLSLDRALEIRGILIAAGIPSERIYVKAMGPPPPGADVSPDRVDIAVSAPPPTPGSGSGSGSGSGPVAPAGAAPPAAAAAPGRAFVPPTRQP
jgi:outer membrane protein OmpA-like peptidoglycan-associated protein